MYVTRALEKTFLLYAEQFACITLYGARQVGKSTLVEKLFPRHFTRISMDDPLLRARAKNDPTNFIGSFSLPLCIDEIQKASELLEPIKAIIDTRKKEWTLEGKPRKLLFILTGSNQSDLRAAVNESLSGRTAILNLPSFSHAEIARYDRFEPFDPDIHVLKERAIELQTKRSRKEIFEDIFRGGMPEYIVEGTDRNAFFSSYIQTYFEKDVSGFVKTENLPTFLRFMQYLALRTACPVNYSDLSLAIGIEVPTVRHWLNILITSKIVILLEPYAKNLSNRIVKTPKLHFLDTGLCAFLGRWPNAETLENGPLSGNYYETYVVSEILKSFLNAGFDPDLASDKQLYYYRDRDQKEIDLIIENALGIYPIEIKKGIRPSNPNKNFNVLSKFGKRVFPGFIIDSGDRIYKINDNAYEVPMELIGF